MKNEVDLLNSVVLTAGVFAAFITSLANIIITLFNNHRLNAIEKKKEMQEMDRYRYSHLYDLLLNWQKYDFPTEGDDVAYDKVINRFMEDTNRYELAKPLMDQVYIDRLEPKQIEGKDILDRMIRNAAFNEDEEEFYYLQSDYVRIGEEFSNMLKKEINNQLVELLRKEKLYEFLKSHTLLFLIIYIATRYYSVAYFTL